MKFKEGDKVVVARVESGNDAFYNVGDCGTITKVTNHYYRVEFPNQASRGGHYLVWSVLESELEHHDLYESPLCQALL